MTEATRVGFIGVGRMGGVMLQAVLAAGYEARVHDARPDAAARFDAEFERATAVSTAREAGDADVVDIVVNYDHEVLDVCLGADGVLAGVRPGTVVLIHSTVSLETIRRVAAAAPPGVDVCDAAVSGRLGHRSVGDLAVMVGGEHAAFERARAVMETYGGLVLHLGPLGAGLDAKLALNTLRYLVYIAAHESSRLAAASGVAARFSNLVNHTGAVAFTGDFSGSDYEDSTDGRSTRRPPRRTCVPHWSALRNSVSTCPPLASPSSGCTRSGAWRPH